MAVEFITYQEKKLPVKLGYYSLKMMQSEHGVSMDGIEGDLTVYEPLLYYALKQGHKVEKREFPFEMDDMVDRLDDCFFDFIALIPKFFPVDVEKMMAAVPPTLPPKARAKKGK